MCGSCVIARLRPMSTRWIIRTCCDYGYHCGAALARSHAKAGDAAAIAGYIGKSKVLDKALAVFAAAYADQTEKDFKVLKVAAANGRISAEDV